MKITGPFLTALLAVPSPGFLALETASFSARSISLNNWSRSPKTKVGARSAGECGLRCQRNTNCTAILYDETASTCIMAYLNEFSSGLKIAWASSVLYPYSPWNSLDGEFGENMFHSHDSNGDIHPWYAIDLLVEEEVLGIKIFERSSFAFRTADIEVRVGNTQPFSSGTNTDVLYTINTVCGLFKGPGVDGDVSSILCNQPIVGRFVTLQRITNNKEPLNWREVVIEMESLSSGINDAEMEVLVDGITIACPPDVGYSECPKEAPYAMNRGANCCSGMNGLAPVNFDSQSCDEKMIPCESPPCINQECRPYKCYNENKILKGGNYPIVLRVFEYQLSLFLKI